MSWHSDKFTHFQPQGVLKWFFVPSVYMYVHAPWQCLNFCHVKYLRVYPQYEHSNSKNWGPSNGPWKIKWLTIFITFLQFMEITALNKISLLLSWGKWRYTYYGTKWEIPLKRNIGQFYSHTVFRGLWVNFYKIFILGQKGAISWTYTKLLSNNCYTTRTYPNLYIR